MFFFSFCLCYNFAFTSMSLTERPFLCDIMGRSLKISFGDSCCCIKCYFLVRISLRFRTARMVLYYEGQDSFLHSLGFFVFFVFVFFYFAYISNSLQRSTNSGLIAPLVRYSMCSLCTSGSLR